MQAVENLTLTPSVHKRILRLMDTRFEISVVADDAAWAEARIDNAIAEVKRIEMMLGLDEGSQTSEINRNAGVKPVKVNGEIFKLISRSIEISGLTNGAFDITCGTVDKILRDFYIDQQQLPRKTKFLKVVNPINYQNIILNAADNTVFLKEEGMRIDFSRIEKGYAADRVKYLLQIQGVSSGVVNVAGDLITWGSQPNGEHWTIGTADSDQNAKPFSALNISNMAITTLGRPAHNQPESGKNVTNNPETGLFLRGIKSVSMISTSAELADAMATPLMLMGTKVGLALINKLQQVACVIIDEHNHMHTSKGISYIN